MPVTGLRRYLKLLENIENPQDYILDKINRKGQTLHFRTKPNILEFDVPDSLYLVFKEIFMSDVYNIDSLTKLLPDRPLVIDIGANAGFFCVLLLSKISNAQIFAYEPLESNIGKMNLTASKNAIFRENVMVNPCAVTGIDSERLTLYMEDTIDNQVVASIFNGFNKNNIKEESFSAVSLSQIIAGMPDTRIDLLKMDCEGSEYDIIFNTPIDKIKRIETMLIEVHDIDSKNNITTFNNYLNQIGYRTEHVPINSFCHALEAYKI